MLTQVRLDEMAGKTIKKVCHSLEELYIVFEDDTFAYGVSKTEWDSTTIENRTVKLTPTYAGSSGLDCPWPAKCIELGIFTQAEYDAAKQAAEVKAAEHNLAAKRAQLEQLQKELAARDIPGLVQALDAAGAKTSSV